MGRENPETKEATGQEIKQLIKDHWPILVGASTIAGAAVFLTTKFLINKRKTKKEELEPISKEAINQISDIHALLETGEALAQIAGQQATSQAAEELAENTDDPNLAEALKTLSQISKI